VSHGSQAADSHQELELNPENSRGQYSTWWEIYDQAKKTRLYRRQITNWTFCSQR